MKNIELSASFVLLARMIKTIIGKKKKQNIPSYSEYFIIIGHSTNICKCEVMSFIDLILP